MPLEQTARKSRFYVKGPARLDFFRAAAHRRTLDEG
jgi:hypothetical protein